jgi:hypothetical protein
MWNYDFSYVKKEKRSVDVIDFIAAPIMSLISMFKI